MMYKKYFISLFFIVLFISLPNISYCEDDLIILIENHPKLFSYYDKVHQNYDDMMTIANSEEDNNDVKNSTLDLLRCIHDTRIYILYSCDLITSFICYYNSKDYEACKTWIDRVNDFILFNLQINLEFLEKSYGWVQSQSKLHIVDKEREIIKSLIDLIKDSISRMKRLSKKID